MSIDYQLVALATCPLTLLLLILQRSSSRPSKFRFRILLSLFTSRPLIIFIRTSWSIAKAKSRLRSETTCCDDASCFQLFMLTTIRQTCHELTTNWLDLALLDLRPAELIQLQPFSRRHHSDKLRSRTSHHIAPR